MGKGSRPVNPGRRPGGAGTPDSRNLGVRPPIPKRPHDGSRLLNVKSTETALQTFRGQFLILILIVIVIVIVIGYGFDTDTDTDTDYDCDCDDDYDYDYD